MASPAQINANQPNAPLSTGPRTVEGKARVSHVIRDDEQKAFAALHDSLLAELDPQGALETLTFHELLHSAWNLQRFSRIEAEVSLGTADDFTDPGTAAVLDRLSRYQSRAQRAFYKAQAELRLLQTNRALRARKLTEEEASQVPAIAAINDLTKQTHSEVTAEAIDIAVKLLNYEAGVGTLKAFQKRTVCEPRPSGSDL